MKEKTEFKFVGLERLNNENYMSATLTYGKHHDTFKSLISGSNDQKESMWRYCEHNWSDKKTGIVEHDGFNSEGCPINPLLIEIRELF